MTSDDPRTSRDRARRAAPFGPAGAAPGGPPRPERPDVRSLWPGNMRLAAALSVGLWGVIGLAVRALLG
jgi:hypothetical protein